jgi:hypothetical protein
MTIVSADVLSGHLKPLCPRDNHVMNYEPGNSRANTGDLASYHCGYAGCSVQYRRILHVMECLATRTPSTSLA